MGLVDDVAQLVGDNEELRDLVGEILSTLDVNQRNGTLKCSSCHTEIKFLGLQKDWAKKLAEVTHDVIPEMRVLRCTPTVTRPSEEVDPLLSATVVRAEVTPQKQELDSETEAMIEQIQAQINKAGTSRLRELAGEMGFEPDKIVLDSVSSVGLSDSVPVLPDDSTGIVDEDTEEDDEH